MVCNGKRGNEERKFLGSQAVTIEDFKLLDPYSWPYKVQDWKGNALSK